MIMLLTAILYFKGVGPQKPIANTKKIYIQFFFILTFPSVVGSQYSSQFYLQVDDRNDRFLTSGNKPEH